MFESKSYLVFKTPFLHRWSTITSFAMVDSTWNSPNNHSLGGIVFWDKLFANSQEVALMFVDFVSFLLFQTNNSYSSWIQTRLMIGAM